MTGYLENNGCSKQYGRNRRRGNKFVGLFVLHSAENDTDLTGVDSGAENVASFICGRGDYGSYHDLVDRDSSVFMAPVKYETWHCVHTNPWSAGISVAWRKADLSSMSRSQRNSYYLPFARKVLQRREEFMNRTGKNVPIKRWRTRGEALAKKPGITTHSRTDPGRRSDPFGTGSRYEAEFLALLNDLANGEKPSDVGNDDGKLAEDGKWGSNTTLSIQEDLDAPYKDGEVSRQNEHWEDENPGLTTGWEWIGRSRALRGKGSQTIVLLRDMLKGLGYTPGKRDGLAGEKFFKALQEWLRDIDLYDGLIDGRIDYPSKTVRALQKAHNKGLIKKAAKKAGVR